MRIPNGNVFQACWYVEDLAVAMRRWHETQGIGPFYWIDRPTITGYEYRGTPTTIDFSAALAQAGPVQIELITQHDLRGSAYRDSFGAGEEGFHHLGAIADDYDATIAHYLGKGYAIAHNGLSGAMRYAYFDTRADLGYMTEIIERDEACAAFFKTIADAAIDWDGSDPYRQVTL